MVESASKRFRHVAFKHRTVSRAMLELVVFVGRGFKGREGKVVLNLKGGGGGPGGIFNSSRGFKGGIGPFSPSRFSFPLRLKGAKCRPEYNFLRFSDRCIKI